MANAANCICVICATGGSQDRVVRNARQFQFTRQVAVLTNGGDPLFAKLVLDQVNLAGRTTGVDIQPITVPGPDEGLDAAFAAMAKAQAEAVVIQGSLSTKRLADLALNRRLPAASTTRAFVDAGISSLVARVLKTDGITPAAIYRLVDAKRPTLLVDAADNLGLGSIGPLRAVLNSGHRRGGSITRFVGDRPRQFSTFAPLALAAIGNLPLPVMHRSIIVQMDRHDGARELRRFDENDPALAAIYREICSWAKNCNVALNPEMPAELRNRQADNWRPLIAIADACCQGDVAREAAIAFASKARHDDDPGVILLRDIRALFDGRQVDRLASAAIVETLNGLEDGLWSECRGIEDDQQPHRLSQGELARLLAAFRIRPRTIWPMPRGLQTRSLKGYYRSQFEAA